MNLLKLKTLNSIAAIATVALTSSAMAVIQADPAFTANGGRRVITPGNPASLPSSIDSFYANAGENLYGTMNNSFLGWPIGPRSFLGARHVAIGAGGTLSFDNTTYTVASRQDLTANFLDQFNQPFVGTSDISLYTIQAADPSFPRFAPLLTPTDTLAAGSPVIVYGKGTDRGTPITATSTGGPVRGWYAGNGDGQVSWGSNRISVEGPVRLGSQALTTYVIGIGFDGVGSSNTTPYEGALTGGDSSGAVFARTSTGQWKLAAINSAVDGPVGYTSDPNIPLSVSFDVSGLYASVIDGVVQTPSGPGLLPLMASGRTTSLSTLVAFPQYYDVLVNAVPEPATMMLVVGAAGVMLMRKRRE